jgi:hypothetical protein
MVVILSDISLPRPGREYKLRFVAMHKILRSPSYEYN